MKTNIVILVAGFLIVSAGLLMKLQAHNEYSDVMLSVGMVAEAYGTIALSVQLWKQLSKG